MAKTIKFNLICDGNSIRTLEDLRNNFSIEDVLEYYHNQLLERWLTVRGYEEQLLQVQSIKDNNEIDILLSLIDIFEIETDKEKMYEDTYILQYKKDQKILLEEYQKKDYKMDSIIDNYHDGYEKLVDNIIENKDNISIIKAAINEIEKSYIRIYDLNYRELFYNLEKNAPMAIFVILMNQKMRTKYIPTSNKETPASSITPIWKSEYYDNSVDKTQKDILDKIRSMLHYKYLIGNLGTNLKEFSGKTDGYWKDIEPKGKKFMILSMEIGNFIRNSGISGEEYDRSSTYKKFMILDGIDYKSNSADDKLLYMEV